MKYWTIGIITFFCLTRLDATVVCIHGFLGAPWNMSYLVKRIEKKHFEAVNWGYDSRGKTIEAHAIDLIKDLKIIAGENPGEPIDFIGHSLGCLILRAATNHPDCPLEAKMGKAVLLAPPNQGSCWGRLLNNFSIIKKFAKKKAGLQLLTETEFDHLGNFPEAMRILVIAGDGGFNPFLEGDNDGTLAVWETYLNTPHEHEVIHAGHKMIVFSKKAARLTLEFLGAE